MGWPPGDRRRYRPELDGRSGWFDTGQHIGGGSGGDGFAGGGELAAGAGVGGGEVGDSLLRPGVDESGDGTLRVNRRSDPGTSNNGDEGADGSSDFGVDAEGQGEGDGGGDDRPDQRGFVA
jgi:hypothetical protein